MSDDYKLGYSKGYNTGKISADARLREMHLESLQVAERAERAEKQLGWGHCEDCANYTKGGENCAWGYCNTHRGAGTPWGTWIRGENKDGSQGRVAVAMRFGCILFKRISPRLDGDQKP
mgnify:CR=1 FL=1